MYLEYPVYRFLYKNSLFLKLINFIIFSFLFYSYFFVFERAFLLHFLLFASFNISTRYLYNNLKYKLIKSISFINDEILIPKQIISNKDIAVRLSNIRKIEYYNFTLFSKKRSYKLVIYTNDYKKIILKWYLMDIQELYATLEERQIESHEKDYPMIKHVLLLILTFICVYTMLFIYYYKIL